MIITPAVLFFWLLLGGLSYFRLIKQEFGDFLLLDLLLLPAACLGGLIWLSVPILGNSLNFLEKTVLFKKIY